MKRTPSVVPAVLRTLLARLAALRMIENFYLADGTGLALLLNHRRSVDLDFFSRTNRLDFAGRRTLQVRLRQLPGWRVVEAKDGTLHGVVGRVRVSFFWYPEPLLKPPIRRDALQIASIEDIGAMKLTAIIGRGSRKDFVDLYAICQRIPLRRLLTLSRRKFKDTPDFTLQTLKALSYFNDAEQEPPVAAPVAWPHIKAFFVREVRRLARPYATVSA